MSKVAKWKLDEVEEMKNLLREYPVVGIINMEELPAKQLQRMRSLLRGNVLVRMSKKSLVKHAIEKAAMEERSLKGLEEYVQGQPAFIFSKINPFKLYKILEKNKTQAPAKPNSIAPRDIVIKKGETPFPPGPMLSELQQAGIPTVIAGGKISVKEDKLVVREGEKINPKLAAVLAKLGIEPVTIGLKLLAAHEKGTIYLADVLAVDEDKVLADIQKAYRNLVNLSIFSGFITKVTAPIAIAKAFAEARALAVHAGIYEHGVMGDILAKANSQMLSLASRLKEDAMDEELKQKISSRPTPTQAVAKEAKKEEKKEEEKKVSEEEAVGGLSALFG